MESDIISKAIDRELLSLSEKSAQDHDPTKGFYISGLGLCLKGSYYKRLGAKEPEDPTKLRIFELGNILEDNIMGMIADQDILIEAQVPVRYPEFDLSGRCDFIIKADDKIRIVEMKTMNSRGFDVMKRNAEPAKAHHQIQVALYWHKLEGELSAKHENKQVEASVLYVNKDTMDTYEYVLSTEELSNALARGLNRARILKLSWDAKTPPEVVEESWVTRYCGVHTYCTGLQEL